MHFERLPLSLLNPAPYNPRVPLQPGDPAWDRLRRSLQEFDLVQPIVWNRRSGCVVSGHQRLAILKHDGATEVDCVVVDLPPERERALNVTLNNSRVAGDWDPDLLSGLLHDLADLPDFDPTLTGFDEQQLQDLLFTPAEDRGDEDLQDADPYASVVATFEIPTSRWPEIIPRFDALLAAEPTVRLHVREPAQVPTDAKPTASRHVSR